MRTTTARPRYQSSELSRKSGPLFDAAEREPIEVTRRDGESLVLMTTAEADAKEQLLGLAAQLIAATTDDEGSLADRFAERFDWMFALSEDDRDRCARSLVRAARASFSTGQAHLALMELASWRATAEALAAGFRSDPVDWLDDGEIAERPK